VFQLRRLDEPVVIYEILMSRPDALFLPETMKSSGRIFDRIAAVSKIAEPLLEVDRSIGERAYIRKQPHGRLFVTRDPNDTIFFPTGHARSGAARYRWEKRGDGTEIGYLVEGATSA
jgi:hypothetical protein